MQMSGYLMIPAVDDRVVETARFGERAAPEPRGRHGREGMRVGPVVPSLGTGPMRPPL